LLGSGGLFVLYIVTFYLALGLAANRTQVLSVGLINYLWPALSLAFSIPILGRRAKPLFGLGVLIALAGTWLGAGADSNFSADAVLAGRAGLLPYLLALVAAVSWALYSNLSRLWAGDHNGGGVPIFLLASGAVLGLMRAITPETSQWSWQTGVELAYMAAFPGMLAYVLWDLAVRKGEITLIASLSYLTPLLSTIISVIVLGAAAGPMLWTGAVLIIVGAVVCKRSILDPKEL
jgi:drug/metabolite transporter (DMT)-like permease